MHAVQIEVHRLSSDFRQSTRLVAQPVLPTQQLPAGTLLLRRVFVGINASDINYTAGRWATSL